MITELTLKNFKCFQQAKSFNFSKLNLLTGINGRGKSSVLQSLLLLSQSSRKNDGLADLILNGDHIELGNFEDVKNSDSSRTEDIVIGIKTKDLRFSQVVFTFSENFEDEFALKTAEINVFVEDREVRRFMKQGFSKPKAKVDSQILLFLEEIHYIGADRLGPIKFIEKKSLPDFLSVGPRGENTINILANYQSERIQDIHDNLYLGKDANHILQQTIEWMNYVLEGASIKIEGKESSSSVLTMLLNNRRNAFNYKQTNVGYGYSYVLPIIVSGLIAEEGQILIVENPEAHLHPRAQSRIAEFLTRVSSCGVQVFIESHSEHILNGLRTSVLSKEVSVKNDNLAIHYFNEDFTSTELSMSVDGKISNWPIGFFDQQEIDLTTIFKLGAAT